MKRGHFVLILCIFFFACLSMVVINQYRLRKAMTEREELEDAFIQAADVAAESMANGMSVSLEETLTAASDSFFSALSMNLFLYEDEGKSLEQEFYVPLLVATDVDGFYMCILEMVSTVEGSLLKRRWTECLPYTYEDARFVYRLYMNGRVDTFRKADGEIIQTSYSAVQSSTSLLAYYADSLVFAGGAENYKAVRRSAVASSIERNVSRALATQSYLAGNMDINISYTCPSFASVLREDIENMFIAIYQGFPSVFGTGYEYAGVKAASFIREKSMYYVNEPQGSAYYRLAHKEECAKVTSNSMGPMEQRKAIVDYGCYGCPDCIGERGGFMPPP